MKFFRAEIACYGLPNCDRLLGWSCNLNLRRYIHSRTSVLHKTAQNLPVCVSYVKYTTIKVSNLQFASHKSLCTQDKMETLVLMPMEFGLAPLLTAQGEVRRLAVHSEQYVVKGTRFLPFEGTVRFARFHLEPFLPQHDVSSVMFQHPHCQH